MPAMPAMPAMPMPPLTSTLAASAAPRQVANGVVMHTKEEQVAHKCLAPLPRVARVLVYWLGAWQQSGLIRLAQCRQDECHFLIVLRQLASSSGSLFSSSVYSHASVVTPPPPFPGYQGMLYPFTQLNPLGSQRSRFRTPLKRWRRWECEDVELWGPGAVGAPSTSPHNPKNRPVQALQGARLRADRGYLPRVAASPSTAPSSQPGPPSPTPPAILTQPNRKTRRPLPALPTK
ncbi:hypothetical protein B0H14DRAFT_3449202 [Mycena olivaceomarginata]|nr:hypothetical protein B0H14DRAFT_3449202 [Mycena olivaceomarginata]